MCSIGKLAELACLWEATIPKPGNVHPDASFVDMSYADFIASAAAIRPVFDRAQSEPLGTTIEDAIRATQEHVGKNTNLGIVLLLAPLAKLEKINVETATDRTELQQSIAKTLQKTTVDDAKRTYSAIRLAQPGGLGDAPSEDVKRQPNSTLLEAMSLATERDRIARQYAEAFRDVIETGLVCFSSAWRSYGDLAVAVQKCFLEFLAIFSDSLILRKCGAAIANEASRRANKILHHGWPQSTRSIDEWKKLDAWLREDGHTRNPGTSADLTAAVLFLALRGGIIPATIRL